MIYHPDDRFIEKVLIIEDESYTTQTSSLQWQAHLDALTWEPKENNLAKFSYDNFKDIKSLNELNDGETITYQFDASTYEPEKASWRTDKIRREFTLTGTEEATISGCPYQARFIKVVTSRPDLEDESLLGSLESAVIFIPELDYLADAPVEDLENIEISLEADITVPPGNFSRPKDWEQYIQQSSP